MGKRKGNGDGEAAGTSAAAGEAMAGEPMVDRADDADKAAEKNRKAALKATRRLARTLCVEFRDGDGEEAEDETGEGSVAGPFDRFPSKKQARKLEPAQRDALVDRLSALSERVVTLSSLLAHKHGGPLSNMEARSQTGPGGFAGTGMERAGDTLKVSAAFVEVDMWRQLSAVSRRCCDEALSSTVDDDEPVALEEEEEEEEEEAAEAATTKGGTAREAEPTGERTAGGKQKADEPKRTFKDWYLENFTDAFAEELEAIRVNELGGGQESSVTSLIDAILVGIDVIPQLEQELCLENLG